jgi:hypothetical protein
MTRRARRRLRNTIVLLLSFGSFPLFESEARSSAQSVSGDAHLLQLNPYLHDHAFDLKPPPKTPLFVPRPLPIHDLPEQWRRRIAYAGESLSRAEGSP